MNLKLVHRIKILLFILSHISLQSQTQKANNEQDLQFSFDGHLKSRQYQFDGDAITFEKGLSKQCISFSDSKTFSTLSLSKFPEIFDGNFSARFWVNTTSSDPTVFLAKKEFDNKGIIAQKNSGWCLYSSGGTFAWSIGSGSRRLNYERDNGHILPIADGKWHQVTMTYSQKLSEVRLYYDGINRAVYKVGFSFQNKLPLIIGAQGNDFDYGEKIIPDIIRGAEDLQRYVNAFNRLGVSKITDGELLNLIVDPKDLYLRKLKLSSAQIDSLNQTKIAELDEVLEIKSSLNDNPYTTSQNHKLTVLKSIYKLYSLQEGEIKINDFYAKRYGKSEQLFPASFNMDNLDISNRVMTPSEIWTDYEKYVDSKPVQQKQKTDSLTVAVWNIWHGGKHYSIEQDGWDSRIQIARILKEKKADIILMQETYSSGDFIAAELGYYFGTTSDWDYCSQGSNISILSKYPIESLHVPEEAAFMNVAAKLALSKTQDIYAMSNWYGMSSFPIVYNFHKERFDQSASTPVLFGGDFNAIPTADGGNSIASEQLLKAGFSDAYRSLNPEVNRYPGYTHVWGDRIDQLYYKGNQLYNISTDVIYTAHGGFPSDHFLILSKFVLK